MWSWNITPNCLRMTSKNGKSFLKFRWFSFFFVFSNTRKFTIYTECMWLWFIWMNSSDLYVSTYEHAELKTYRKAFLVANWHNCNAVISIQMEIKHAHFFLSPVLNKLHSTCTFYGFHFLFFFTIFDFGIDLWNIISKSPWLNS